MSERIEWRVVYAALNSPSALAPGTPGASRDNQDVHQFGATHPDRHSALISLPGLATDAEYWVQFRIVTIETTPWADV